MEENRREEIGKTRSIDKMKERKRETAMYCANSEGKREMQARRMLAL